MVPCGSSSSVSAAVGTAVAAPPATDAGVLRPAIVAGGRAAHGPEDADAYVWIDRRTARARFPDRRRPRPPLGPPALPHPLVGRGTGARPPLRAGGVPGA